MDETWVDESRRVGGGCGSLHTFMLSGIYRDWSSGEPFYDEQNDPETLSLQNPITCEPARSEKSTAILSFFRKQSNRAA
jgi:hypothetical protein